MKKVRYGVIGLGYIAQSAVLPGFRNAKKNSKLVALISTDKTKLKSLGRKYKVKSTYLEKEFVDCLKSGEIDALYIATPNTEHRYYAELAAEHGVHVLCEKPLAENLEDSYSIFKAVQKAKIKFMTAYRLHFDPANLKVIDMIAAGKIGNPRFISSVFSTPVKDLENIRLKKSKGGGPLNDIGIYCINASRYLFGDEPIEVTAMAVTGKNDPRFREVPEMLQVTLRFPEDRLASFVCSFGGTDVSRFEVVGDSGSLHLDGCYDYAKSMELVHVNHKSEKKKTRFKKHDQFGAELLYFSNCIIKNKNPEPSVVEGLADLFIIDAIQEALRTRKPVKISAVHKQQRPDRSQSIRKPRVKEPKLIHSTSPSRG